MRGDGAVEEQPLGDAKGLERGVAQHQSQEQMQAPRRDSTVSSDRAEHGGQRGEGNSGDHGLFMAIGTHDTAQKFMVTEPPGRSSIIG